MWIDVLHSFKHDGNQFHAGEFRKVSDEDGVIFCKAGWARDISGNTATGSLDTSPQTLDVQDGWHFQKQELHS